MLRYHKASIVYLQFHQDVFVLNILMNLLPENVKQESRFLRLNNQGPRVLGLSNVALAC